MIIIWDSLYQDAGILDNALLYLSLWMNYTSFDPLEGLYEELWKSAW